MLKHAICALLSFSLAIGQIQGGSADVSVGAGRRMAPVCLASEESSGMDIEEAKQENTKRTAKPRNAEEAENDESMEEAEKPVKIGGVEQSGNAGESRDLKGTEEEKPENMEGVGKSQNAENAGKPVDTKGAEQSESIGRPGNSKGTEGRKPRETGESEKPGDTEELKKPGGIEETGNPGETGTTIEKGIEKLKRFRESYFQLQRKWGLLEVEKEEDRVFQTGRLLVEAEGEFPALGAKETLAYGRYYVLQYDTLEAVKAAYERLHGDSSGFFWVVPDILYGNLQEAWKEKWKAEEETEFRIGFLERWKELLFSENLEGMELWGEEVTQPELYNTKEEYYGKQDDCRSNSGYFYLFVRKKEVEFEQGSWYKVEMSLPTVSSYQSQAIAWRLLYLKKKVGGISNIANWSWSSKAPSKADPYSLELEKGKSWEKTRQNGSGANPILRNMPAIPENTNGYYFKLCGKLLYDYPGYQMVLDESVYQDLDLFDIEPENMQIQRKDNVLDPDEKSWTGDGYFKFAIDTNNTGMTNYGESHNFHHAVFGLCLKPNQYTVQYKPNGGIGTMADTIALYDKAFSLRGNQFQRQGYTFDGWSTKPDGSGKDYKNKESGLLNLAQKDGQAVSLYAQWKPKVYKVTLKNQLKSPESAGTKTIYERFEDGWFLDASCKDSLKNAKKTGRIEVPVKDGYVFLGYYDEAEGGSKMIDKEGRLTKKGTANYKRMEHGTWYAQYKYLVSCQDYADVPCDIEKPEGEKREDLKALVTYEETSQKTIIQMSQGGFTVSLAGMPKGSQIGLFVSAKKGRSVSGSSGQPPKATLSFIPDEEAAYRLTVIKNGKELVNQAVYFKNGRFRALVKLGVQEKRKKKGENETASGEEWEIRTEEYPSYRYAGCSSVENIQSPEIVCRYFVYKHVNVAYHGNGATAGRNVMECNVPLEAIYQVRESPFVRIEEQRKESPEGTPYPCLVKYAFQGWRLGGSDGLGGLYQPKEQREMAGIYGKAKEEKSISFSPLEPYKNYDMIGLSAGTGNMPGQGSGMLVAEYINFMAEWDAFPTIVLNPEDKMEFYEGEYVTKEDLVARLAVHDTEDSKQAGTDAKLSQKVQIRKISYPAPKNRSQKDYVKKYQEDVPEGFLFDTYYLKLEEKEKVQVSVTFSVEDSRGNRTEEEIPVTIKYNNYPKIESEDVFYFLKEEANRGDITPELLISYAKAEDLEDGDISRRLTLKDFESEPLSMQTETKAEFKAVYQVTDNYRKTAYKEIKLVVWDEEGEEQAFPKSYVRYISQEHLGTLEEHSKWRETGNFAYLQNMLSNQASEETWNFSHRDVLAAQEWMTEGGDGSWKAGQEANQKFLEKFASCRK